MFPHLIYKRHVGQCNCSILSVKCAQCVWAILVGPIEAKGGIAM